MSKENELVSPQSISAEGPFGGLTKRELFAAMAMVGYLSNSNVPDMSKASNARLCIEQADALLKELNK